MQQENTAPGGAADEAGSGPINEIEALLGEVERLRATVVGLKDETLRERAELDNQRKRLARDVEMARKFANERLLSELLPVFDSLDAGLGAAAGEDAAALRAGLDLTLKQLLKVAADNGLVVVDPLGEAFNPTCTRRSARPTRPAPSPARSCRCSRRVTCSTTACCAPRWW